MKKQRRWDRRRWQVRQATMKGNKRTEKYALTCSWAQGLASLTEESMTMVTYKTSYKTLRCAGDAEEQNKSVRSPKRKVGEFRVTWHVCLQVPTVREAPSLSYALTTQVRRDCRTQYQFPSIPPQSSHRNLMSPVGLMQSCKYRSDQGELA